MRHALLLSALFLLTLLAGLLLGVSAPVYANWTGGFPLWPAVLGPALAGLAAAWCAARWLPALAGPKAAGALAILAALAAFATFGDSVRLVHDWTLLSLRLGLGYEDWRDFVLGQGLRWFGPLAALVPFLWGCGRALAPRARLTVFVGLCVGVILARILGGRLPTVTLWDVCLAGLLLAAPLLLAAACARRRTRWPAAALALPLLAGWYFLSQRTPLEPLREVNPFAPIAARDSVYTGQGAEGVTLRDGRLLRTAGVDEAALAASQLIPTLLRPDPNARIAARPAVGAPLLPNYETGRLKGLYDALWVELPPAWVPQERDYFGGAALAAALGSLNEGGLLVYDLDARALDARMVMARVGALRQRLPFVQLWMTGLNRWQLVASRKPIAADLGEITALLDRPAVAGLLLRANLGAPITLLPCCVAADAKTLEAALAEPIPPKVPRRSAAYARRLLFDGLGGQRLVPQFAPLYDAEMAWVALPKAAEGELRDVLAALRQARRLILKGDYHEASKANPSDPVLLGLADRERAAALAFERLADHENALRAYASAFALATPRPADVLAAAAVARATGKPGRAEPYLRLAESLAPEDPAVLAALAAFRLEDKAPAQAEHLAARALRAVGDGSPETALRLRFLLATAIARQAGREAEGLALARRVAAQAKTPADKDTYIPAYGQLLIDAGHALQGVAVKRHYQAYHELLPEAGREATP